MKNFEITNEQILELAKSCINYEYLKQWFPDAFKPFFTGWAKDTNIGNEKWIAYFENDIFKYGIGADGKWFESKNIYHNFTFSNRFNINIEATPQEVESALICEAKNRGYKEGIRVYSAINDVDFALNGNRFYIDEDGLRLGGVCIFNVKNGIWATIIQPEKMTLSQIEKELGRKIELI